MTFLLKKILGSQIKTVKKSLGDISLKIPYIMYSLLETYPPCRPSIFFNSDPICNIILEQTRICIISHIATGRGGDPRALSRTHSWRQPNVDSPLILSGREL